MIKRDEIASPASCLNRAADDEPVFVLRANDETAATIVREWAYNYLRTKGGLSKATPEQVAKYNEALGLAATMTTYRMRKAQS